MVAKLQHASNPTRAGLCCKLEQKPLSSQVVMELVVQSSKAWNSSRLKVCDHLGCADHCHGSLQRLAVPSVMFNASDSTLLLVFVYVHMSVWQCKLLKTHYCSSALLQFVIFFMQQFPELKFRYVEEDQPDEFFIPYVWSLVFHHSGLHWDGERVKLQHFQEIPASEEASDSQTQS